MFEGTDLMSSVGGLRFNQGRLGKFGGKPQKIKHFQKHVNFLKKHFNVRMSSCGVSRNQGKARSEFVKITKGLNLTNTL